MRQAMLSPRDVFVQMFSPRYVFLPFSANHYNSGSNFSRDGTPIQHRRPLSSTRPAARNTTKRHRWAFRGFQCIGQLTNVPSLARLGPVFLSMPERASCLLVELHFALQVT